MSSSTRSGRCSRITETAVVPFDASAHDLDARMLRENRAKPPPGQRLVIDDDGARGTRRRDS